MPIKIFYKLGIKSPTKSSLFLKNPLNPSNNRSGLDVARWNTKVALDPAYNKRIKALETQWKNEKKIDNPYLDPEFIRQTKNIKSEFVNDYVGQELSNSGAINVTDIDEALKNSP